jgi:hypothetical protein
MEIRRISLRKDVTIRGRNIFGFPAHITLNPSATKGWHLSDSRTGWQQPINKDTILCGKNNFYSKNGATTIHGLTNIMALRWYGLDGVSLSGSKFPPAYSTEVLWEKILAEGKDVISEGEDTIEVFDVVGTHSYSSEETDYLQETVISGTKPGLKSGLENIYIDIYVSNKKETYDIKSFASIVGSYTHIYHSHRQHVANILSWIGGPHFRKAAWAEKDNDLNIQLHTDRRALDLFGTMAMIDHQKLPVNFHIHSHRSEHKHDLSAIQGMSLQTFCFNRRTLHLVH